MFIEGSCQSLTLHVPHPCLDFGADLRIATIVVCEISLSDAELDHIEIFEIILMLVSLMNKPDGSFY